MVQIAMYTYYNAMHTPFAQYIVPNQSTAICRQIIPVDIEVEDF